MAWLLYILELTARKIHFARRNGGRPSFSLVTLQTYGLPSHQGGNDYWSGTNRFFFFFWSKLRCDFSQVPWEHAHIFLPTWSVSQQLSLCGTWKASLDVWSQEDAVSESFEYLWHAGRQNHQGSGEGLLRAHISGLRAALLRSNQLF